tara:strand:+ start:699 stop:1028 length:330 start_codon:yes stop_codon:yes gene_type:complete
MNLEQYLDMCEQMGWEPKESEIPKDPSDLSYNVQCALVLFNSLPDIVEGMSGTWMGKNYSGLIDIMNIFSMDNKKEVFNLLKVAEGEASKYYAEKQKQQESLNKAKRGR